MEELAKLAYDAALRALDKQEEAVREIRARTAVPLATSSFAISLAGPPALRSAPALAIGATAAAVACLGASLYVLLPQRNLTFALHGRRMLTDHHELRDDLGEVHRRLVYELGRRWDANDVVVIRMLSAFRFSAAALSLEILLLLVGLRSII